VPKTSQPSTAPGGAVYLTAAQLRTRYGGVSHMWIERTMARDPTFPRPTTFGSMFRFWRLDEIEAWERASAKRSA
jgi:predicted DNA-binding transcriptional regulator AlpA